MEFLVLTVALLGSIVESQYPYGVPPYFVVTQRFNDVFASASHMIPVHHPQTYYHSPQFAFPRYFPINGAWMGSHSAYQQPINNLPPLPPIPAGYPPLPSLPPPGGSGTVVVTPGGGGGIVTPVQPPRPVQPPVVVQPPTTTTTPRPSVPVTQPPPSPPPPPVPVVVPTTPRPVRPPTPVVPVTLPPPRPVVTPKPVPVQPPQDDDDDDDIADPISNPPVLSAARNPSPFQLYYDNPGDFFIDPRLVVDIKKRNQ